MSIVVTGGAGFIGSHLVTTFVERGERVVVVDRRRYAPAGAVAVVADLSVPLGDEVVDALRSADAVFHLAGCPGVRGSAADIEARRHRDNVVAGARVLAAVPPDVPVIVTSSSSIYGGALYRGAPHEGAVEGPRLRPSREDDPPQPRGGYARSKLLLERLCRRREAGGGLVAVARPFTVAGERQRPDMAIATWIAEVPAGRPIRILGAPARRRDVTDVRDVVRGLIRIAEKGVGGVVNLGTGTAHRLDEMVAAVARALGVVPDVVVEPAGPEEPIATLADTARCARLLGFVPADDLFGLVRRQVRAAVPVPHALAR